MAEFVNINIDDIIIDDRFRKDVGDVSDLAESIADLELLSPIGVTQAPHHLIYGYRRLLALKELGAETVLARVHAEIDPKQAEIDENLTQKPLTYSERFAIAQYLREILGNRQGVRTDQASNGDIEPGKRTDEYIAKKAGFGSRSTLRNIDAVMTNGIDDVKALVDSGSQ